MPILGRREFSAFVAVCKVISVGVLRQVADGSGFQFALYRIGFSSDGWEFLVGVSPPRLLCGPWWLSSPRHATTKWRAWSTVEAPLGRAQWSTGGEQVCVKAFAPQASNAALQDAVLHRFTGHNAMPFDLAMLLPFERCVACLVRPVVADHHAGEATPLGDAGQFANALLHLPDGAIAGHVVILGHGHCSSIQHQTAPTIQQVRRNAIPAGHDRDAGAFLQGLLHDPQLLARGPAAATAAIGDDLYLRHKHVLRHMPKPPWLCPSVRSKWGPVHFGW